VNTPLASSKDTAASEVRRESEPPSLPSTASTRTEAQGLSAAYCLPRVTTNAKHEEQLWEKKKEKATQLILCSEEQLGDMLCNLL